MRTLGAADLATLGRYLYGSRWQSALARALDVDPRLVRRWAAGARPVSPRCADLICRSARQRHARRLAAERRGFHGMLGALASAEARAALLVMGG